MCRIKETPNLIRNADCLAFSSNPNYKRRSFSITLWSKLWTLHVTYRTGMQLRWPKFGWSNPNVFYSDIHIQLICFTAFARWVIEGRFSYSDSHFGVPRSSHLLWLVCTVEKVSPTPDTAWLSLSHTPVSLQHQHYRAKAILVRDFLCINSSLRPMPSWMAIAGQEVGLHVLAVTFMAVWEFFHWVLLEMTPVEFLYNS